MAGKKRPQQKQKQKQKQTVNVVINNTKRVYKKKSQPSKASIIFMNNPQPQPLYNNDFLDEIRKINIGAKLPVVVETPAPIPTPIIPPIYQTPVSNPLGNIATDFSEGINEPFVRKKPGRPKGSKNKRKKPTIEEDDDWNEL
jgi:hypothetical protein